MYARAVKGFLKEVASSQGGGWTDDANGGGTWVDKTVSWIGNHGHELGVTVGAGFNAYAGYKEFQAGVALIAAPTGVSQAGGIYLILDGTARMVSAPLQIIGAWTGNSNKENLPGNLLGTFGFLIDNAGNGSWSSGGDAQFLMELTGDSGLSRRRLIQAATEGFTNPNVLRRIGSIGNAGWKICKPYVEPIKRYGGN